jgi:hypothetical protein
MSKYQALVQYIKASSDQTIRLDFAQIEQIIGETLPPSARKYPAWWANSRTDDSHSWAHLWIDAGFQATRVDLANQSVRFDRTAAPLEKIAPPLLVLLPRKRAFVMDLLVAAGIDVSAWAYTSEDVAVKKPKANPSYCYDWSFGSELEGFVLCIWHGTLERRNDQIIFEGNLKKHAELLQSLMYAPGTDGAKRSRLNQQVRRAKEFEKALEFSYRKGRHLKVILNVGDQRSQDELAEKASKVWHRALDGELWYVHRHDPLTGQTLMVRDVPPEGVDNSDARPPEGSDNSPTADDQRRLSSILTRRGQGKFRESLFAAYNRQCAVTGTRVVELLEAAHIIPHAEQTDYATSNGLLLRADIHTLYDLKLLSVDERFVIHLSESLLNSDYRQFHGKRLRVLPDRMAEQPSSSRLQSRHARFIATEMTKK